MTLLAMKFVSSLVNQPVNWNILSAYAKGIWAVAGPLVGVFVGAYIASRNQRKHWIADNKKEEYKELLAALSRAITASFAHRSKLSLHGPTGDQLSSTFPKEVVDVAEAIQTRIFIAPVVTDLKVLRRWHAALQIPILGEKSNADFSHVVGELLDNIREAARKDVGA